MSLVSSPPRSSHRRTNGSGQTTGSTQRGRFSSHGWARSGIVLVAAACLIAGCSSSTKAGKSQDGSGSGTTSPFDAAVHQDYGGGSATTQPGTVTTIAPLSAGSIKVRFFDNIVVNGKPAPAIDIYDSFVPDQTAGELPKGVKPIVTHLTYGSFSKYVVPQMGSPNGPEEGESWFTVLPSGTKPSATNPLVGAGGLTVGTSPPQGTVVLTASDPDPNMQGQTFGPLGPMNSSLSYGNIPEKKGGQQGAPPSSAPGGKAAFVVNTAWLPKGFENSATFFFIDDSCDPSKNGDGLADLPDTFVSGAASATLGPLAFFPTDPGTHQIALTSWASTVVPTCEQIKPTGGETTVNVQSGDTVLALPYGIDKDHVMIATGVIE